MRTVLVVVVDVVDDDTLEVVLVPDDRAVEQLAADGADPAFGERVRHWRAHRGLQDLHPAAAEDLVECVGELAATVVHERTRGASWSP